MTKNLLFSLPEFVQQHVWEFSPEKREYWDNMTKQFMKGGFHRKTLRSDIFLANQSENALSFWESTRPGVNLGKDVRTLYQPIGYYFKYIEEWSLKKKHARMVDKDINRPNWLSSSFRSGSNPVSKWTNNIVKWETKYPNLCEYLPKNKVALNIPMKSKFYIDRKKKILRKKERHKKKGVIKKIQTERLDIFRNQIEGRKYGFQKNQIVYIGFTNFDSSLTYYRGIINSIILPRITWLDKTLDINIIDSGIEKLTKTEIYFPEDGDRRLYSLEKLFHLVIKGHMGMTKELAYLNKKQDEIFLSEQKEYFNGIVDKKNILQQGLGIITSSSYFQIWIKNNLIELENQKDK
jgi:hypothetical protein